MFAHCSRQQQPESNSMPVRLLMAAVLASPFWPQGAVAEGSLPTPWQIKKCQIYRTAWNDLPMLLDTSSFSHRFRAQNESFIASGCLDRISVCPVGDAEMEAANLLTIAAMNGGTASTFLPFRC